MTVKRGSRIKGLTVVLDNIDIRSDDAQYIIDAILMIKGVLNVTTHTSDAGHYMAVEQAKNEIRQKIYEILK